MMKYIVTLLCFLAGWGVRAQKEISVNLLDEVSINATKKDKNETIGQKKIVLTTKQTVKNPTTFTSLLRYNSPIVLRDYGNGGTSIARFRGTSATNTSVQWNGININATGNGQTDFNSLSANTVDNIIVKSGGGSVEYGSGAIGGVVLLNDILNFKKHRSHHLFTSYGDFNTSSIFFKTNYGFEKWAFKIASSYNFSDNNYPFLDARYKDQNGNHLINENGTFYNYEISLSTGYKISDLNTLYFFTTKFYGNRLFSDGLPNPSAGSEKNEDFSQRSLLKWVSHFSNFKQEIKLAYLTQEFHYYEDKNSPNVNIGSSKRLLIDYTLNYQFSNLFNLKSFLIYENTRGLIDNSENKKQNAFSIGNSLNFIPNPQFKTSLSVRQEFNSNFNVPLSVSLAAEKMLNKKITLKTNLSTNYRVPTFNERYWPIVGNKNLIPENSYQADLGVEFKSKSFDITTTLYYIKINNKIIWEPKGGSNLWKPKNIQGAKNYGAEIFLNFHKNYNKHQIQFSGNYIYTIAKNADTNKFLSYTPKHLFNYNIEYSYGKVSTYIQKLYQSKVYTNEINIDFYSLETVNVLNYGIAYDFLRKQNSSLSIGLKINNLFNQLYYFSNLRPMPGRNFQINMNYKF